MRTSAPGHRYEYRIDEHGDWFCEGNPVTDPELFRILSRSLFQRSDGFFIRCEGEIHPVHVADAPVFVRYVHVDADVAGNLYRVDIELCDGRREPLRADTLTVACNDALYCLATPRRLKARFSRTAYNELTRYLQSDEAEKGFHFVIGSVRYDIRSEQDCESLPNRS